MKAMTLISREIKKNYGIDRNKQGLHIHKPAYINIDFDEMFEIKEDKYCFTIQNKRCIVSLFKGSIRLHITIF